MRALSGQRGQQGQPAKIEIVELVEIIRPLRGEGRQGGKEPTEIALAILASVAAAGNAHSAAHAAINAQRPRYVLQRHDLRRRTERPWDDRLTRVTTDDGTDGLINRLCNGITEVGNPATHGLDFRIGQFMHFTHDFPP
jgi:predicted phage tail protein